VTPLNFGRGVLIEESLRTRGYGATSPPLHMFSSFLGVSCLTSRGETAECVVVVYYREDSHYQVLKTRGPCTGGGMSQGDNMFGTFAVSLALNIVLTLTRFATLVDSVRGPP